MSKYLKHQGALYVKADEEKSLTQHIISLVDYDDGITFDIVEDVQESGGNLVDAVTHEYEGWVIDALSNVKWSHRKDSAGHDRKAAAFLVAAAKAALKEVDWPAVAERAVKVAKMAVEGDPEMYADRAKLK